MKTPFGAVFAIAFLLGSHVATAQSATTGALSGTVKDAAGAPVVEARVTVVDDATKQRLDVTTDAAGAFRFAMLAPGAYELRIARTGFRTARLHPLTINISEAPTLDAVLDAGEASAEMECRCTLQLSTSSTGTLVDSKSLTAIPLTTRNFTQVLSMASGSAADVNNAGTLGRGTRGVNVNGNTSAGAYTLDGASAPSAVPNPDTIAELKIHTSQYDALYGAQVPSTALVTKSGESEFHGDAWEFVRNDVFNANAFFRNATAQPKPNLKQNQFGATLGGPVLAKRLFFFSSYQGTRQVNGLDTTSTSNPILPALTDDRSAGAIAAAFCPANHAGDARYLSYAGGRQLDCGGHNTASTAAISPVALRLLQAKNADGTYLIPTPQTLITTGANAGLGFSTYSLPSTYKENQYLLNLDYIVSPSTTIIARSYLATIRQFRTFGSPSGYPGTATVAGAGTPQALNARDWVTSLAVNSALTKTLVNEARFAFTRSTQSAYGVDTPTASSLGMTPADRFFDQPPEINVLGSLGSFRVFGNIGNDFDTKNRFFSLTDNVSWSHGHHALRAGAIALTQTSYRGDLGAARGKITFQTFSDFLLGLSAADNLSPAGRSNVQSLQANEGAGPHGEVMSQIRTNSGALYVQDDVKLAAHLTVNLGLRWELLGAPYDETGALGNFWPALATGAGYGGMTMAANYDAARINPYTGQSFGAAPDGVLKRSTRSPYSNTTPLDALAPRFGFAWQPAFAGARVAVRGGYGWFYQTQSGGAANTQLSTAAPFAQGFTNSDASNGTSSFARPFPAVTLGFTPRTWMSQLSDRVAGPEYRVPRLQQWNLSTQYRIARGVTFDVGYVGSHGSRLQMSRGLNQPLLADTTRALGCGYDGDATHCITTNTAANARWRVPVLGETPTALLDTGFFGASSYHSLQATLRKQIAHVLTLQATYTYSRAATNTSVYNDLNNLDLDWARASFDRAQRFTTNFDYQLPALTHARGWRSGVLNGWSLAGIVILQSGSPMTLSDPNGGGVYGHAATSTITLCNGATYADLATAGSVGERLGAWFNTRAICAPARVGADGSTAYGTAGQSIVDGPGQFNTDFSIGKRMRVGGAREDAVLAFRMELYNALNHAQFANPGTSYSTATFGVITQTSVAPRLIQFALKYLF